MQKPLYESLRQWWYVSEVWIQRFCQQYTQDAPWSLHHAPGEWAVTRLCFCSIGEFKSVSVFQWPRQCLATPAKRSARRGIFQSMLLGGQLVFHPLFPSKTLSCSDVFTAFPWALLPRQSHQIDSGSLQWLSLLKPVCIFLS